MAEKLDSFDFGGRGGRPLYNWHEWFDGNAWKLTRGVDFTVQTINFKSAAYMAAKRYGGHLRTRQDGDNIIVLRFHKGERDTTI